MLVPVLGMPLRLVRRRRLGRQLDDPARRLGDRHPLQQVGERQRHAQPTLDRVAQLDSGERVHPVVGQGPAGIDDFGIDPRGDGKDLPEPGLDAGRAAGRGPGQGRVPRLRSRLRSRYRGRNDAFVVPAAADHLQRAVEIERAAAAALDLAAGRPRHPARRHEHDLVDVRLVLFGDGPADRGGDLLDLLPRAHAGLPLDLQHRHQPLLAALVDRERGAAAGAQAGVAALRRELDILRIEVAAPQDDQVLDAAGDEQLAAMEEAEVAGAQERPLAGRQPAAERRRGLLGTVPVAARYAGAGDPDLPHLAGLDLLGRLRVDHRHPLVAERLPRAGEEPGIEAPHHRLRQRVAARDHERGLGEAVAGVERAGVEAADREGAREAVQRLGPNRLGAIEGDAPGAQVQAGVVGARDLARAEVVGEVGSAARRALIAGDRLQPAHRALQERHRRHQHARRPDVHRLEHVPDQAEVVVDRQPGDEDRVRRVAAGVADQALVVEQVAVADHDPLGRRGRAGGVLQEREVVRPDAGIAPAGGQVQRQIVGRDPGDGRDLRVGVEPGLEPRLGRRRREHDGGPAVVQHGAQARQHARRARRIGRDGDDAGVEAAEEGGDEFEPGREEQQRAGAWRDRRSRALERGRDGARLAVQLRIGEVAGLGLPILQEGEGPPARLGLGTQMEHLRQALGPFDRQTSIRQSDLPFGTHFERQRLQG